MRGRKLVGESKLKAQLKPQARPLSEISENESKTKFELNEDSFLVNESKPRAQLEFSEKNFLSKQAKLELSEQNFIISENESKAMLELSEKTSLTRGARSEVRGER